MHADFNLTNACNLACSHCHSASGKALPDELTTAEIFHAIDQLHAMGTLSVAFAGGEPFMRRDILDVLQHACQLDGWTVSVITNGLFLGDRVIAQLQDRCPELGLNVSIDGSTPDSFSTLRAQPGATAAAKAALFRRVTSGVRAATSAGLAVSINTTMTRATIDDLRPTYDLVIDDLGAQAMVAIKFFPAGYGRDHLDAYDFPTAAWHTEFLALTREKMAGRLQKLQLSLPSAWEFYLPLIEGGIDIVAAENAWHNSSPLREPAYARLRSLGDVAGVTELCISGDGSLYPSVLMVGEPTMYCGSLRDGPLAETWRTAGPLLQLRGLTVSDLPGACRSCAVRSLCGGGSRSRALADHGRVDAPDVRCPIIGIPSAVMA
jgi:radical SAM protein with 4Fe4S-binding SPASM domain